MRILLVEDEVKLANSLKKALESATYAVDIAADGDEAYDMGFGEEYDLIILDLGLPKMDGLSVAKKLRDDAVKTPILILTARDTTSDKISGLDSGGDDYLVKPFEFDELLARARALIRRSKSPAELALKVGDLTLDPRTHKVIRAGKEIELSAKEYSLLEYLIQNNGSVVTRQDLIDHVWDIDLDPFSKVIDVYIGYLRNKIDRAFPQQKPLLKTVKGMGYKLG